MPSPNRCPCLPQRRLLPVVFLSTTLLFSGARSAAQRQTADAAEISRDLLYLAPQHVTFSSTGGAPAPTFILRTGYAYQLAGGEIRATAGHRAELKEYDAVPKGKRTISAGGMEYTLTPQSDDDRATLSLSTAGAVEPITAVVWTREQLATAWLPLLQNNHKGQTAAALRQDLEVSDPVIYDLQADGDSVWAAIGHSTGESELGIGTVVRFDLAAKRPKVYQPRETDTCAITKLAIGADKAVWLTSRRQYEGTIQPCAGLLRLEPATGQTHAIALPLAIHSGTMVTAVAADTPRLWAGTDAGLCSLSGIDYWSCLRIVPSVSLKADTPMSNIPGDKPSGKLKPGDYEVRWANTAFLEVVTQDSFDAWIAADDFQEAAARNFDIEPYKLLNTAGGGVAPIRLFAKPGDADGGVAGALVYRAELKRLYASTPTPAGWVRVRARIGWIERKNLEVVPKTIPIEAKTNEAPAKHASHP